MQALGRAGCGCATLCTRTQKGADSDAARPFFFVPFVIFVIFVLIDDQGRTAIERQRRLL